MLKVHQMFTTSRVCYSNVPFLFPLKAHIGMDTLLPNCHKGTHDTNGCNKLQQHEVVKSWVRDDRSLSLSSQKDMTRIVPEVFDMCNTCIEVIDFKKCLL